MAGIERIRAVATRVKREVERGNQVAVVVSAMAGETDRLVQLCREAAALYDPREYDVVVASGEQVTSGLLAITLQGMGLNAKSYMGWQLPIRASGHSAALIEGIDVEVIDLRSLQPLDVEAITTSVNKTGRAVIVHEAPRTCGLGAELSALIQERCFLHLEAPVARVTGFDTPFPYTLENEYLPRAPRILRALREVARF